MLLMASLTRLYILFLTRSNSLGDSRSASFGFSNMYIHSEDIFHKVCRNLMEAFDALSAVLRFVLLP